MEELPSIPVKVDYSYLMSIVEMEPAELLLHHHAILIVRDLDASGFRISFCSAEEPEEKPKTKKRIGYHTPAEREC